MGDAEDRTCYVSNFTQAVTSDLLEELFTQVGPLEKVAVTEKNGHRFAMVMFEDEESVPFAVTTLDGIHMFGTPLNVKPRNGSKHDTGPRRSFDSKRREPYPIPHSSSYPDSRRRDYNGRNNSYDERWDNSHRSSHHTPSMAVLTPPPPPPPPNSYPSFKTRTITRAESYNTPKSSFTGRPGGDQRRTFPSKPSDTRVFDNDSNGRDRWRSDRGRGDRYSYRNSSVSSGSSSRSSREYRRY
ncbi:hypothetical protein Y032_0436g1439 [Ancylostoma ceylanicum]|uniref:RRM domain-containing protein n=1 Tax=Ancylostoma ceylanicum TaxID=53326 RepID=A0A016X101_9BILA|nr:hypothetical protein Y032_0436g1439 [Ancylostoma ceylanicum]